MVHSGVQKSGDDRGDCLFDKLSTHNVNDTQWHAEVWCRNEHGSGLKPILAGSGLDRTAIFLKIGRSGLDRTKNIFVVKCDYSDHVENFR